MISNCGWIISIAAYLVFYMIAVFIPGDNSPQTKVSPC